MQHYIMGKIFACSLLGVCVREREKEVGIEGGEGDEETIIGTSVSKLHTSELNCEFSHIYGPLYRKRVLRVKFMNIQYSKYVIFDKSGIIAILSCYSPEVKHMHTPMSESAH